MHYLSDSCDLCYDLSDMCDLYLPTFPKHVSHVKYPTQVINKATPMAIVTYTISLTHTN